MPPAEQVTDTHLHLWDLDASPYAWLAGAPHLRRSTTWADAREGLESLGVTRVVLVQADDTREDTANLQREAERIEHAGGPVRRADVVGWLPLEDPDALARLLDDRAATERLVGVRHLVHDEPDAGFLERPAVSRSLEAIARAGLALDMPDAAQRHMGQVARLADAHPDLPIVLDHVGKPPLGDPGGMDRWEAALREIAVRPRTMAKISGLSTAGDGSRAGLRHVLRLALELFGPERCMVGSDWPIAPVPFTTQGGFGTLLAEVAELEPGVRAELLHGTAARVYRRPGGS